MHPLHRMQLLRTHRSVRDTDAPISDAVSRERFRLERIVRESGGAAGVWDRVVPGHLRTRGAVLGLRAGVLTVRCRSASDRFALDRWLRAGGERALREAMRASMSRVKLTLR